MTSYPFSQRLKELRRATGGMKQEDLSQAAGLTQGHFSKLETGTTSPTRESVEALAHALGVNPWTLIGGTEFEHLSPDGPLVSLNGQGSIRSLAYFASALTGLNSPDRQALFGEASLVRDVCEQHTTLLYEPSHYTDPVNAPHLSAPTVYATDRAQVTQSDVVVLHARHPSFGAGQELEIASHGGIPVILISERGTKVSRMVLGAHALLFHVEYSDRTTLLTELRSKLPQALNASRARVLLGEAELGRRMRALRTGRNLSIAELSRRAGVSEHHVQRLEVETSLLENPSLTTLRRVAGALGTTVSFLVDGVAPASDIASDKLRRSREALDAVARRRAWAADEVEERWSEYTSRLAADHGMVAAARTEAVSEQDWIDMRGPSVPPQMALFGEDD